MVEIFFVINRFLTNFSRRIRRFFHRQNVFLVDDKQFQTYSKKWFGKSETIKCDVCDKKLTMEEVQGWYFDGKGIVHFFCSDQNCNVMKK